MFKTRELIASLMSGHRPPQAECERNTRDTTYGCPAGTDKDFSGDEALFTCGCPACTDIPDRPEKPEREAAGLTSLRRQLEAALVQSEPA